MGTAGRKQKRTPKIKDSNPSGSKKPLASLVLMRIATR
jgi:hypothetical protein